MMSPIPLGKRLLLAIALSGGIALWPPIPASAATFGEVVGWCSAPRVVGDDTLCSGYVTAVLALLRSPDPVMNGGHQVCAPTENLEKTVVPLLTAWSKAHPDSLDKDVVAAMGDALADRYGCK
jgi:hypothetical protein